MSQSIKSHTKFDKARKQREEDYMSVMKKKVDDNLMKKRNIILPKETPTEDNKYLTNMNDIAAILRNPANDEQLKLGVTSVRKMLSTERNPPIADVINAGVVPNIVELLKRDDDFNIQFEAAWALTNIASGSSEQTRYVVSCGAVSHFVRLLLSPSKDVCDQAVWALGNIAGDGAQCRDLVLEHGVLNPLLNIISKSLAPSNLKDNIGLLRNATWTLSNLCRGKPHPKFEEISPILDAVPALLASNDHDIAVDALWAVSHMTDSDVAIPYVLKCDGLVQKLALALNFPDHLIITPALRSLGNIVTGTNEQTQAVLDAGVLPSLKKLLHNPRRSIQKEVCWMISNITAGTKTQISEVITAGIIPDMFEIMKDAAFEVKREACWSICNASINGSKEHVQYLVSQGAIEKLCEFLNCSDPKIVIAILEALNVILDFGVQPDNSNPYADLVEKADGLDKLEALQSHSNFNIYKKALEILEGFFNAEEEAEGGDDLNMEESHLDFTGFGAAQ